MTTKWDEMSLTERTNAVNNLKAAFDASHRNVSMDTLS